MIRWDPFVKMSSFEEQWNRLLEGRRQESWLPAVDALQDP